jgi:hypothetical protein
MTDENNNYTQETPAPPQGAPVQGAPVQPFSPPQNVPQQPYQQPTNQPYQQGQYKQPGDSAATASMVCGIIGLFFFGLILGIVAIVQSNKAKKLGYVGGKATAGFILGVIGIIGWAIIVFYNSASWLS